MKIKIEGKLKDGFFEWLNEVHPDISGWIGNVELFMILPQSAQFGLLQEYADTLGYDVIANPYNMFIHGPDDFKMIYKYSNSRPEAQAAATKKLNEIVNHD